MCDLQLRKVITSSIEFRFGVLRLYGKLIESRFLPYFCGGHWVLELPGKGKSGRSGRLAG